jgi:hypothetical protein
MWSQFVSSLPGWIILSPFTICVFGSKIIDVAMIKSYDFTNIERNPFENT